MPNPAIRPNVRVWLIVLLATVAAFALDLLIGVPAWGAGVLVFGAMVLAAVICVVVINRRRRRR
jgi:hypothetical protein